MQPKEHLSQNPEKNKDIAAFSEAQRDFLQILEFIPEDLQVSRERVEAVMFVDWNAFTQLHYEDEVAIGMPEDEAWQNAKETSSVQHATYFEFTDKIAVAAKHDVTNDWEKRRIEKNLYYFSLMTHELGHVLVPRRSDISPQEAASLQYMSDETFRELVERQLQQNPNFFLSFLTNMNRDPSEFLEYIKDFLQRKGDTRTSYKAVKAALSNQKEPLLAGFELTTGDYEAFARQEFDNCCFSSSGRMVGIQWGEQQVVIDRLTYLPEKLLSELQADTYMHYTLFLRYVWKNYGDQTQQALASRKPELFAEYQKSPEFRSMISLNELSSPYILEAAQTFHGFERLLRILIDAQKSDQEMSKESQLLTSSETAAIEAIVKAGQSQEVLNTFINKMDQDAELTRQVFAGVWQIVQKEQRQDKALITRLQKKLLDGEFGEQLYKEFDAFTIHEWFLRAAKPILVQKTKSEKKIPVTAELPASKKITSVNQGGFYEAALGIIDKREVLTVKAISDEESHPVLKLVKNVLEKGGTKNPDVILEKAVLTIARNRRVKYKNT